MSGLVAGMAAGGDLPAMWRGLESGPHDVGVTVRRSVDYGRTLRGETLWPGRPNPEASGVRMGLVLWYPARPAGGATRRLNQLDYHMFAEPRESAEVRARVENEAADLMVRWRHVGIVPLTKEQAAAALRSECRGVRDAQPAGGKFPVVLAGNPHYMATTAEYLASYGFVVASVFRYDDAWVMMPDRPDHWFADPHMADFAWGLAELVK